MTQSAFVTYNQLGDGNIASGWHARGVNKSLVLQNTEGRGERKTHRDERISQLDLLWKELQKSLHTMDNIVVYLGANGSQRAIELLARSNVPASKVTFVSCTCGLLVKEALIQTAGYNDAHHLLCGCGGNHAMEELFNRFMETGTLPS